MPLGHLGVHGCQHDDRRAGVRLFQQEEQDVLRHRRGHEELQPPRTTGGPWPKQPKVRRNVQPKTEKTKKTDTADEYWWKTPVFNGLWG